MTTRRKLLSAIPLLIVAAIVAALVALPRFVASNAHRHTIEALASSLTGRQVHIAGHLSLALLPAPQLIAGDVSIGGPADEVITARSLTLDIALPALLRGRLAARSLTLQSPRIVLPWPLPGGAATIVPPPWLAALHAQISGGTVSIGALTITGVDADIFTVRDGALSVSGTGLYQGAPLTLSLGLSAPDATGRAALAIDSRVPDGTLGGHFSGVLEDNSAVTGHLAANFRTPDDAAFVSGTASIAANAAALTASDIHLSRESATLSGNATFNLQKPAFALDLVGDDLSAVSLLPLFTPGRIDVPGHLALSITNLQLPVGAIPEMEMQVSFGAEGVALQRISATLPGGGTAMLSGKIDASGALTAQAAVQAVALSSLATAFGQAPRVSPGGRQFKAQAKLNGSRNYLNVTDLQGSFGPSHATGSFVLRRTNAGITAQGAVHFDQLDVTALAAVSQHSQLMPGLTLAGEISADRANFARFQFSHLLLDAVLSRHLVIHRLSAALYSGVAIANLALTPDGTLVVAQARLAVPAATPLAALFPVTLATPAVLLHAPLTLAAAAAGPPGALRISAVGSLGDISVTASPVIDIPAETAIGPITLRHPDAIAALAPFGVNAGLAWPGAGSIALRADMLISPTQYGLPDFVLSFGDLTANGKIMIADDQVRVDLVADTLALPMAPPHFDFSSTKIPRQINAAITSNRVWFGGQEWFGPVAATLATTPDRLSFTLDRAALGGGDLSGTLTATLPNGADHSGAGPAVPELAVQLKLAHVESSGFALPIAFPYTIPEGSLTGSTSLTADGFGPATWAATLGGGAHLGALNGQLAGFDLAAFRQALQNPHQPNRKQAASAGVSNFTSLAIDGTFDHGIFTLKDAGLQGPDGNARATGSIDLPDRALDLHVTLSAGGAAAASTTVTSVGNWQAPHRVVSNAP